MSAPTKEQLDRYMDLVVGGEAEEDAIAVIWGDEKPAPAPKKPTVMVTEFPDGVVIGWDHCASLNGGCGKTVAKCECKDGRPKELKVFEQWRTGSKTMPDYSASNRAAKAAAPSREQDSATHVVAAVSEDLGRAGNVPADLSKSQVPCVLGKHLVPIEDADQNDDLTYSCFDCQEKGLQRERSDA